MFVCRRRKTEKKRLMFVLVCRRRKTKKSVNENIERKVGKQEKKYRKSQKN